MSVAGEQICRSFLEINKKVGRSTQTSLSLPGVDGVGDGGWQWLVLLVSVFSLLSREAVSQCDRSA